MAKPPTAKVQPPSLQGKSKARSDEMLFRKDQEGRCVQLVEIRIGLFLNLMQIVTLRVLPQEDGDTYAILQLANGDKLNITRSEFALISGTEPRLPVRPHSFRAT
ncbi:MAG: hypothetical protein LCI02_22285 [Proteobacteria bacterium]|nr:hypothetical protein [Pseudomonadota bacterium]